MNKRGILRLEIEQARVRLDYALEHTECIEECYEYSLVLDKLIEEYIALCGQEELVSMK